MNSKTVLLCVAIIMLFVPLIFPGCKSNKEQHSDNKEQTDSTDIERRIINGHTVQPLILPDTYSFEAFSFDGKNFEICYNKGDNIYFYDIGSSETLLFPEPHPTFSMTFSDDGKTMYYTVFLEGTLCLKKAEFSDTAVATYWLLDLKNDADAFITQTYGEKGQIVFAQDTVYIETGYEWLSGFFKTIRYSVKDGRGLFDQDNNLYTINSSEEFPGDQYLDSIRDYLVECETDGVLELFFLAKDSSLQLTHTKELDEEFFTEENMDENTEPKSFSIIGISEDLSNLLVGTVTTMGDLAHGPYFLVDVHGNGQALILEDGFSNEISPLWLPDKRNIAVIDFNHEESGMLQITQGNNNLIEIDDEVDFFTIRKKPTG